MNSTANASWINMVRIIISQGLECGPQDTAGADSRRSREVLGYRSVIDMTRPIVTCSHRKLGYKFQAAEAWHILSGRDDVESISRYSSKIAGYSDDGVSFFGSYGVMLARQLPYVISRLVDDPNTRQAVVQVWRESPPRSRDVPCTLSWQFILRHGRLHCVAAMRSSDAWLGWPYDVFNFSCVTALVALHLRPRPELGTLYLTCGSQHLYSSDYDACRAVHHDLIGGGVGYDALPVLSTSQFQSARELTEFLRTAADGPGSARALLDLNAARAS